MEKSATISPDGKYRYDLYRRWDDSLKELVFIMLNPSKADADIDDQTITRCIDIAEHQNCGGIYVVNIFAYRATCPKDLLSVADPVGPENMEFIKKALHRSNKIICAWGSTCSKNLKKLKPKLSEVKKILRESNAELLALKANADDEPHHPLRLTTKYCYNPQKYEI